jgi:hypothetical protein
VVPLHVNVARKDLLHFGKTKKPPFTVGSKVALQMFVPPQPAPSSAELVENCPLATPFDTEKVTLA